MGLNPSDFSAPFFKREQKLQNVTHRHTIHDCSVDIFAAHFSWDQTYMAAAYADGTVSIYGSYHGDRVFRLKDPEISYPVTGLAWKPTSIMSSDAQSFKAVGADGRIV